jgi:hypothetical protein
MHPLRYIRIEVVMLGLFNNAFFVRASPATAADGGAAGPGMYKPIRKNFKNFTKTGILSKMFFP